MINNLQEKNYSCCASQKICPWYLCIYLFSYYTLNYSVYLNIVFSMSLIVLLDLGSQLYGMGTNSYLETITPNTSPIFFFNG